MRRNSTPVRTAVVPLPWSAPIAARVLLMLLAALLVLAALLLSTALVRADDDDPLPGSPAHFVGVVEGTPADGTHVGEWTIEDTLTDDDLPVIVAETTLLTTGVPLLGHLVQVTGIWVEGDRVEAASLTIVGEAPDDDDDEDDEGGEGALDGELSGFLKARPDGGIGDWVIQCEPAKLCTVVVTATTVLEDGVVEVGLWVEARGVPVDEGTLLAERVRLDEFESDQVVVRLDPTQTDPLSFAAANELTLTSSLLASANIYVFTTLDDEEDLVQELLDEEGVVWAELNLLDSIPGNDGYKTWRWGGEDEAAAAAYRNQGAFAQVQLAGALKVEQGEGALVAVLDTGLHLAHPAFAGRLAAGLDVVGDDVTAQDEGPGFGWGHGTHVGGIVAHMAPKAKILPVRVLDANGRGNTFTLAYAIIWAADQGADVINLSLGADGGSRALEDAVAYAHAQGAVVVAAAGNEGTATLQYPAGFAGVISVAAVDSANRKAAFSNYGDWVDLAAPGVGITSTVPFTAGTVVSGTAVGASPSAGSPGYAAWSGSSMSTAFVSGAAALLVGHGFDSATVSHELTSSAEPLEVADPQYGAQLGGLLNVAHALDVPDEPPPPPPPGQTRDLWLPFVGN